jgi:phage terminase large subunit-like protein
VTPIIETGRVFLPDSAPWLADFVDSMASFPNAAHDDDVDSTTQALNYLRETAAYFGPAPDYGRNPLSFRRPNLNL